MNIYFNFSPNYSKKKRPKKQIVFVIIHYTGMQSEIDSVKRLKNPDLEVSCHYIINRQGKITQMVRDKYVAWHAGKSKWKNFKDLNKYSLGVELVNKGHKFGYQKFSNQQIKSLIKLCKKLKKKYLIKKENFLGHSDIAPLRKIDPGEKFPWKELSNNNLGKWYNNKNLNIEISQKKMKNLFFKNLKKIGYRYFSLNFRSHKDKKLIRVFQQHYLPKNVTGKIDKRTLEVSQLLI